MSTGDSSTHAFPGGGGGSFIGANARNFSAQNVLDDSLLNRKDNSSSKANAHPPRREDTGDAKLSPRSRILSIDEALSQALSLEGRGKSPIYMAVFNMLAGCGVVGLPVTYKNSGIVVGLIIMVVVAVISVYTMRLLVIAGKRKGVEDYERLVSECFGAKGYYFVSICILVFDIGACITYTIILGNSAADVLEHWWGGPSRTQDRQMAVSFIYVVLILPFCLGKNFAFIEKVSAGAIIMVFLVIVVVVFEYYHTYQSRHEHVSLAKSDSMYILSAIGTISFGFVQHDLTFLVYQTLLNNTIYRFTLLSALGLGIQCGLCMIMCVYGYLSFGAHTNDDILTNFDKGDLIIIVVRILYTFRMAFVFPTAFYVVRHICYALCFKADEQYPTFEYTNTFRRYVFTFVPLLLFMCIGLFLKDLGFTMSMAGLLSALNIAFVLPCACYIHTGPYPYFFFNAKAGQKWEAFKDTFPSLVLIVFGSVCGVVGSIELVADQFDYGTGH